MEVRNHPREVFGVVSKSGEARSSNQQIAGAWLINGNIIKVVSFTKDTRYLLVV